MKHIVLILTVCLLFLGVCVPIFAKAQKNGTKTLIYIYSQDCGYCKKFNPIYEKLKPMYSNRLVFSKIDVDSMQGQKLAIRYHLQYVPYVVLDNGSNLSVVNSSCLLDMKCMQIALDSYLK